MIVAEAPGAEEDKAGRPFVGAAGSELSRMLLEVGLLRNDCFITNVCRIRPPDNKLMHYIPTAKKDVTSDCVMMHDRMVKPVVWEGYQELLKEIEAVNPNIIICFGNLAFWALTGKSSNAGDQDIPSGITSWRGSLEESLVRRKDGTPYKIIPTYHPANILREWYNRYTAIHDLRRVLVEAETPQRTKPKRPYRFLIRPTYVEVMETLDSLYAKCEAGPTDIVVDLETRKKHIACMGLGWSVLDAMCIPFMCVEKPEGYWNDVEEAEIWYTVSRVLTHPNARVIGQNFQYDSQYLYRRMKFIPNVHWDTMTAHHVMFLVLPRALHFQASLYSDDYVYWKDEGKEWDPNTPEDRLWNYNCMDCSYTFEIKKVEEEALTALGQWDQFWFQMELWWAALGSMLRGMPVNQEVRQQLAIDFDKEMKHIEQFFVDVLGHPLNPRSSAPTGQMRKLFYDDLKCPVQFNKKKQPTLDDKALEKLAEKEPLLRPLIASIGDYRTLGVFKSTFCESELDEDGRMRCTIDENGTDTLRFASYENAFYTGMNMQNLPSDKSKAIGKAVKRNPYRAKGMELKLPNIRALFPPDKWKIIWDADLDRADLQVVVWEANDQMLKDALRRGVDIHLLNAFILAGKEPPDFEELIENGSKHDRYLHWRSLYKLLREFAKVFVHGTNYGGSAKTMAANCGVLVHEADRAQRIWFGAHPGIRAWQEDVMHRLETDRTVSNRFGYKVTYFDRIELLLGEALAWIPQSTVSCIINRGWVNLVKHVPETEVLIQVHDSLVGQFDAPLKDKVVPLIKENLRILVPYEDPLIIPVGVKTSEVSWGDCK